jgi:hypothetical protein
MTNSQMTKSGIFNCLYLGLVNGISYYYFNSLNFGKTNIEVIVSLVLILSLNTLYLFTKKNENIISQFFTFVFPFALYITYLVKIPHLVNFVVFGLFLCIMFYIPRFSKNEK